MRAKKQREKPESHRCKTRVTKCGKPVDNSHNITLLIVHTPKNQLLNAVDNIIHFSTITVENYSLSETHLFAQSPPVLLVDLWGRFQLLQLLTTSIPLVTSPKAVY